MSQFPNSPKLVKGALLEFGDAVLGLLPNVILFQYNPDQLTHKLVQAPTKGTMTDATTEKKETLRTSSLPVETISDLKIILDATDQMEKGDPIAAARGIGPAIAALEMMMFPIGTAMLSLTNLLGGGNGSSKIPPMQQPLVLFVWGPWRIVPVNITSVDVSETTFDPLLNPIRAEVSISFNVISKDKLERGSYGYGAYEWTQANREINTALNIANTVQQAAGMLPF